MNILLASDHETTTRPELRVFLLYFLRLGTLGFGGPIALVGYMQRDLVEKRKWVSREDYFEGLAFSQLCPGPLAAQRRSGSETDRSRICLAVVPDGFRIGVALRAFRAACLDSGFVLRNRSRR